MEGFVVANVVMEHPYQQHAPLIILNVVDMVLINLPPSCPLMSTYNSLSGQCECMSGYVASGNTCISKNQACINKYGVMAQEDYLSGGCKCVYGYVFNDSSTSCISGSQYCSNKYGYNSEYDSLSKSCKCRYGYVWNTTSTECISEDEACQNEFGYNSKATISGDKCECKYGYAWNEAKTKCISNNEACHEQFGVMSQYDSLSGDCECLSGWIFEGSECVPEPVKAPVLPIINQNKPTPIQIEVKEKIKDEKISTPGSSSSQVTKNDVKTQGADERNWQQIFVDSIRNLIRRIFKLK